MTAGRFLLALSLAATLPGAARARCTTQSEVEIVRRAARAALGCASRRFVAGSGPRCSSPPPPPCAGTAVASMVELFSGSPALPPLDATSVGEQVRCQRAVFRSAGRFLTDRVAERRAGEPQQLRSAGAFDRVLSRCAVPPARDSRGVPVTISAGTRWT